MHLTFGFKLRSYAPQEAAKELRGAHGLANGQRIYYGYTRYNTMIIL